MIARVALSLLLGLAAAGLVYFFSSDLCQIADFYAKNIRASLFTGFLTVGSFLLSLKVFIVVKFKENIFDSSAYKDQLEDKRKLNPDLTHYGPVKRLSRLLFFSIVSAIAASAAQLSIGLIPTWQATLFVSVWRRHLDSAAGRGEDARAALEWERSEVGGFSRSSWLPAMGQQLVDA